MTFSLPSAPRLGKVPNVALGCICCCIRDCRVGKLTSQRASLLWANSLVSIWSLIQTFRVFTCENSHGCEFHTGMTMWFHTVFTRNDEISLRVYMKGHFMPADVRLLEHKYALPVPDSRKSDFILEQTVVPRLHHIGMSRTRMKISLRYSYRGECAAVWLAPAWDFVLVSCNRIQSHKREPQWTGTGIKVAPVSCKHPLSLPHNHTEDKGW